MIALIHSRSCRLKRPMTWSLDGEAKRLHLSDPQQLPRERNPSEGEPATTRMGGVGVQACIKYIPHLRNLILPSPFTWGLAVTSSGHSVGGRTVFFPPNLQYGCCTLVLRLRCGGEAKFEYSCTVCSLGLCVDVRCITSMSILDFAYI